VQFPDWRLLGRLQSGWIAGPVIHNLKVQKIMHGLQRFGIVSGDPHLSAPIRGLERVGNRIVLFFHNRHARRHGIVDKHRDIEVVGAEHRGYVRKVCPDLVAGGIIVIGISVHFDDSTIRQECEMVRRGFVREAHRMVTTHIDPGSVRVRRPLLIVHGALHGALGGCCEADTQNGRENDSFHDCFLSFAD